MRPNRRLIAWLFASWLAWAFVALHVSGQFDTIFNDGDHWSHFGCAELFLHHGFEIWSHRPADFCSGSLSPEELASMGNPGSCEICGMRDLPGSRPVCVVWQKIGPQPYPPGLILYSLPQALLWEHTGVTFRMINVLTILEYLAAGHLLFWILLRMVFPPKRDDDLPGGTDWELSNPVLRLGLFGVVYLEVIKRCLDGFYDPLAVFAMCLGTWFLAKRRPLDALVAISASFFLHYRAIWYAPLLAAAAVQSIPVVWAATKTRSAKVALKLFIALLMLGSFAYSLYLFYPWLHASADQNAVAWIHVTRWKENEWDLLLPMGVLLLYLAWGRHWLMLSTMAWQLYVISTTRQIMAWHVLFLLPMLGLARLYEERGVMRAAVAFYLLEAVIIFNTVPLPGQEALPLPGQLVAALAAKWGPLLFR